MSLIAKISNRVVLIANITVVLLFLLAVINPYVNPQVWPVFSLLSLAFPFLLLAVLLFLFWWLIFSRKWIWISIIAIVLGGGAITDFFAFKFYHKFVEPKPQNSIRIATWNVARFIEMVKNNNKGSQTRYKMLQQIKQVDADILCMQEFTSSINPDWYNNIIAVGKGLDYPYYYFSHDWDGDRLYNGSVIFSRLPILDTGMVRFPRPTLPEALVFADIQYGNKKLRVYTTHLQSNQFKKEDIAKIDSLKAGKESIWKSFYILKKLQTAITHRSIQADVVGDLMKNSPYPIIFCGDLNDVPNSYTYKTVRGKLKDAFLAKSFGIGRTYNAISPTLRIDYIFVSSIIGINQFKRITTNYSDHYMLVADILD